MQGHTKAAVSLCACYVTRCILCNSRYLTPCLLHGKPSTSVSSGHQCKHAKRVRGNAERLTSPCMSCKPGGACSRTTWCRMVRSGLRAVCSLASALCNMTGKCFQFWACVAAMARGNAHPLSKCTLHPQTETGPPPRGSPACHKMFLPLPPKALFTWSTGGTQH